MEGFKTGGIQEKGMQEKRDTGKERFRTGGIKEKINTGKEGFGTGGIQD